MLHADGNHNEVTILLTCIFATEHHITLFDTTGDIELYFSVPPRGTGLGTPFTFRLESIPL
jgi:hypothetical protein